jgi:ABC-type nickel/cobalt efflux system permease component RcnA
MNPLELAHHAGAHPLLFLGAALVLGALHGLEPGHSKGIMTAFMIGTRGTYGQAVVLALCATLSHTAVVWVLAVPASYGGAWWSDAQIEPYLSLVSGIVILGLAWWMLRRLNRAHTHDHDHGLGHDHGHEHAHDHPHDHDHDHAHGEHHHHHPDHAHDHTHPEPESGALTAVLEDEEDEHARHHMLEVAERFSGHAVSTGQVALFGLSSGLAPCSAAIVILITCFRLHEPWLGLALVAAFSAGLALTLTGVALAAAWGVRAMGARSHTFGALVRKAPFLSAIVTAGIGIYLIIQFFRSY